mmetsp:Transcript_30669/g.60183  ORF Transcript_30669/g.60183 Transcript_30669/m.60183 type:complete len:203 (+) Transcript_30669:40-648(+)|eukprot:CAMPEP_0172707858 /NCGR_PEP_ID=MMETSP1074-20121228/50223_1 /TAXON_ID=2916 /ORGANISM="Ceratium fusus, Strain PA161109" /LENGTH=202 /DNA_ID=CAMNT_0013530731 /DNA_START=33 /DNA_END=641 /DNA_ORIENTATION=-
MAMGKAAVGKPRRQLKAVFLATVSLGLATIQQCGSSALLDFVNTAGVHRPAFRDIRKSKIAARADEGSPRTVFVPTTSSTKGVRLELSPLMKESEFNVVSTELPLGVELVKNGPTYIVEEILPGGPGYMGSADMREQDLIRAVVLEANGRKGVVETKAFKTADELNDALMMTSDGKITMVIERKSTAGLGGIGWMMDVANKF